jgi:phenylacetate-CoA ligase
VFTTLHNFLAPFVRYDILDEVTLGPGPCPCGRGLPLWTHVEGRQLPFLYLPNGHRKASIGLVMLIRKAGGTRQFQFIQRAVDHIVVRVVPDPTWAPDNSSRIQQVVRDEFAADIRVDIEEHPYLERPAGGKLKIFIQEVDAGSPSQ